VLVLVLVPVVVPVEAVELQVLDEHEALIVVCDPGPQQPML